jgi:hypothetical protein
MDDRECQNNGSVVIYNGKEFCCWEEGLKVKEVTPDFAQFVIIFMVEAVEVSDSFYVFLHSQMVSLNDYVRHTKIMAEYL